MKENIKHLFHIIFFAVILIAILIKITDIMENKSSVIKYETFIKTDNEYDIFFLGTSHVINGVNPIYLYNDYGITSYNFGNYSSRIPETYYTLLNALNYKTPQMVVIDLYGMGYNEKVPPTSIERVHFAWDAFPISFSKVIGVYDVYNNFDDKMEMLFTLAKYHSRWTELTREDFNVPLNKYNGCEMLFEVAVGLNKTEYIVDENTLPDKYDVSMEYIQKIIELCQEKEIKVLLCWLPYRCSEEEQIDMNYGYYLSGKYNIDYLNFLKLDIVNIDTDFKDQYHLNMSGAYKVTTYLGEYISNNYNLSDYLQDEDIEAWTEKIKEYVKMKNNILESRKNVNDYLMMLSDNTYECEIFIRNIITEESKPTIYKLINNIDGIKKISDDFNDYVVYSNLSTDYSKTTYEIPDKTANVYITVYDKLTGDIVSQKIFN